jgi:hypothetical protein
MLSDRHAQIAVEGLEHDVERLTASRADIWLVVDAGKVRDEEWPADQAEDLKERGEDADSRGEVA